MSSTATGSLQVDHKTNELYLITCAHAFTLKSKKSDLNSIDSEPAPFKYADHAEFYIDLDPERYKTHKSLVLDEQTQKTEYEYL